MCHCYQLYPPSNMGNPTRVPLPSTTLTLDNDPSPPPRARVPLVPECPQIPIVIQRGRWIPRLNEAILADRFQLENHTGTPLLRALRTTGHLLSIIHELLTNSLVSPESDLGRSSGVSLLEAFVGRYSGTPIFWDYPVLMQFLIPGMSSRFRGLDITFGLLHGGALVQVLVPSPWWHIIYQIRVRPYELQVRKRAPSLHLWKRGLWPVLPFNQITTHTSPSHLCFPSRA